MGTRLGAAVLAMLLASVGPASAVVRETAETKSGILGAVGPGIEISGWITPADARGHPVLVHGTVDEIPDAESFTWADEPLPMSSGEGIEVVGADHWHRAGRSGAGVKVAVVDLGFEGYWSLLGDGLPASVRARSFRQDRDLGAGLSHGTAAAEIVHQIAPGAELYLINYDYDLGSVVDFLIAEEIDIVSFSVGYLGGPLDGTSPIAATVQRAVDAGIVWVTAAGNYARRHWGATASDSDDDGWLQIDGGDEINEFRVPAGAEFALYLSWTGDADLDLCLYEMPAAIADPVACASGVQANGSRRLEVAKWQNGGSTERAYGFAVRSDRGEARWVDVFGWNIASLEHPTVGHSIVVPGDVEDAVTVGAVPWSSPQRAASFSSRGPTADGRRKPDLVAPSGVSTISMGAFVGTSASTPHVAGLAALLWAAYPATPPGEVGGLLAARALPLHPQRVFGEGLARAGDRRPSCSGLAPTILGTGGDDRIDGTGGVDVIHGLGGDDVIGAGGGDDVVCGGTGRDVLRGGAGDDRLAGNRDDDRLFGAAGSDRLNGGGGDDLLAGGWGGDRLRGGPGQDHAVGGPGTDHCSAATAAGCEHTGG